jgi:hypothetical protein
MRASRDELPELLGAAIRGSDWGEHPDARKGSGWCEVVGPVN